MSNRHMIRRPSRVLISTPSIHYRRIVDHLSAEPARGEPGQGDDPHAGVIGSSRRTRTDRGRTGARALEDAGAICGRADIKKARCRDAGVRRRFSSSARRVSISTALFDRQLTPTISTPAPQRRAAAAAEVQADARYH